MRLSKLTRVTAAALLVAGSLVYLPAIADVQHTDAGPGLSLDVIKEQEALAIAKDAYIYAYPLVTMELTRRAMTNTAALHSRRFMAAAKSSGHRPAAGWPSYGDR